ncbi:MAG: HlyC/CorC family transporter [Nitrospirae bacterium]|nr:MAG: HlyC/CorC family transporter [Nitrospirota bacterium]
MDPDPAGLTLILLLLILGAENLHLRCRARLLPRPPVDADAAVAAAVELGLAAAALAAALAGGGLWGGGVAPGRLLLGLLAVAVVRDPLPVWIASRLPAGPCRAVARAGGACHRPLALLAARAAALPEAENGNGAAPEEEEASDETIRELLHNVYDFGDTRVREVMTPRPDIFALDADLEPEQVVPELLRGRFSRVPVIEGDLDHVVGIVYAKDLLAVRPGALPSLRELAQPPLFVPETRAIDDLLRDFQRSHVHIAIVVDEHGATAGLVCMEDVLRELVGELGEGAEEEHIRPLGDGRYRVSAMTPPEEFNERFATHVEGEDFETLGGYVIQRLDHFPSPGERLEVEGVEIRVAEVDGLRVVALEVTPRPDPAPEAQAEVEA